MSLLKAHSLFLLFLYYSLVGAEWRTKLLRLKDPDCNVQLQMWALNQLKFQSMNIYHYREATAALVIYDITREDTFQEAKECVGEFRRHGPGEALIALVGNKSNLAQHRRSADTV